MPDAAERRTFDGVDILFAGAVDERLARSWCVEHARWFDAGRRPVPRAEEHPHLSLLESPIGTIVAKRELPAGWKSAFASVGARELRCRHAFRIARRMRAQGIGTPEPLAVLVRRIGGRVEGVLVSRYVAAPGPWEYVVGGGVASSPSAGPSSRSSLPARHAQSSIAGLPPECSIPSLHPPGGTDREDGGVGKSRESSRARLRSIIRALAEAIASMHAAGFRHRDLKTPNILVRTSESGAPSIEWLDLDGAAELDTVRIGTRVRDLARLGASFASRDALAAGVKPEAWSSLVRAYVDRVHADSPFREIPEHAAARIVATTRRWATRHIERNISRGRPVT